MSSNFFIFILIFIPLFINADQLTDYRVKKIETMVETMSNENNSLKLSNQELKSEIQNLKNQNTNQFNFYRESLTNNEKSNTNTLDFLFKVISAIYILTLSIFGLIGWGLKSSLTKWLSDQIKSGIHEKVNEDSVNQILQNVKDSVVDDARREILNISNAFQLTLQEHESLLNKHNNFIEQFSDTDPQNISVSQQILVTKEAKNAENKTKKDEEDWFAIALKEHNEKNYTKAIYAYNKVLQINPENVTAISNLGSVYSKQGLFELAEKYFQDVFSIEPKNARASFLLAEMYKNDLHNNEQAEHYYKKAILSNPHYSLSFISYAELLEEQGKIDLAKHYFLEAIDNNPNDSYVFNRYGSFLLRQNHDVEEIKEYFLKAISLTPNYVYALLNYANLLWKMLNDLDQAKEYFLKTLESEPSNVFVLTDYADYLFETGNLDDAKIYYEKAMDIDPDKVTFRKGYQQILGNV